MAEPTVNYHPWAEVYVVKSFSNDTVSPDAQSTNFIPIQDIISASTTLSVDGPGSFNLTIDNRNERYMIPDRPTEEIHT